MHFIWGGWRRDKEEQPAASGLTGAPELVEPPREPPKNWGQRWTEIKQAMSGTMAALPRVMRLVWQASPGLTIALFVVTALSGLMPAASAYTAKDRKSTRLNSSHLVISYAVFCLKKKK